MDFESILYGLIGITMGVLTLVIEARVSAKEKRERNVGYSEAAFIGGGWAVLISGILMLVYGLIGW